MLEAVKKFGDWLLEERFDHKGTMGWSYQHYFKGKTRHKQGKRNWYDLKTPEDPLWHMEYFARFLGFCSIAFDDPTYLDAWAESYSGAYDEKPKVMGDHSAVQIFQYIPWLQAKLIGAKLTEDGILVNPLYLGERTPKDAIIMGPDRDIKIGIWK